MATKAANKGAFTFTTTAPFGGRVNFKDRKTCVEKSLTHYFNSIFARYSGCPAISFSVVATRSYP
jgi:hypothetical protein